MIISLADYFFGCISLTPNRLNQQGKNIRYCVYFPTAVESEGPLSVKDTTLFGMELKLKLNLSTTSHFSFFFFIGL